MTFNDSNQMNSRKQVSNGYDDTSMGDEQIRPWYPSVPGDRGWNHRGESWTGAGNGYHRGESWTGAGGRIDEEEDRGRGQHAGDDTEG